MNEWVTIGLIAAGIALGIFPIFVLLLGRKRTDAAEIDDDAPQPALGGLTEPFAAQLPMTETGREDVQKLLMGAGYYHRTALTDYRAIRTVLTLAPLLLTGAAALLVPPERLTLTLIAGGLLTLLGFSLPRVYLAMKRRQRAKEISRSLPLAVDMLTLCLTAGQNIPGAFHHTARELKNSHPALAQELAITGQQAELHSLEVACAQWADRVQVPEVSNVAMTLIQSERLGTDTAQTLSEQATNFRTTARQRAEAHANRTSFWMLFPSVFCFWVAAAIILVGPAYLQFFEYRQTAGPQLINQTRQAIERANRTPQDPASQTSPPVESTVP